MDAKFRTRWKRDELADMLTLLVDKKSTDRMATAYSSCSLHAKPSITARHPRVGV